MADIVYKPTSSTIPPAVARIKSPGIQRIRFYQAAASGTRTLYTVPDGYRAKLLFLQIQYITGSAQQVYFMLDSVNLWGLYVGGAADIYNPASYTWIEENAPIIFRNITASATLAGTTLGFSYIVFEELIRDE